MAGRAASTGVSPLVVGEPNKMSPAFLAMSRLRSAFVTTQQN
jgi:hypothetical protein